ncbi:MAG: phosphoribosylanthranilate isomerase [Candidatus Sulfotelmatobacter sp.]|jgi:phosphoribosylanthranilate isomerase
MTWVKICGMTNLEDALIAVEAGADAVGFVFYEKSPRNVTVELVREIVRELPEGVEKVGVFVGGPFENIVETLRQCGLTTAQIYPREPFAFTEEFVEDFPFRLIPAISAVTGKDEMSGIYVSNKAGNRVAAILVDSGSSAQPGGTGESFDWNEAAGFSGLAGFNLVVAGGLTPQNVSAAIETLRPWGVDVVSGVEAAPGKKDPEKVRAFVRAVRDMDRKVR